MKIVNDFQIQIGTVNGSGSQSANHVLMRAIFRMGVPVSGKNLFPSNIQGLPTWFTIRISKDGYVARKAEIEILIAMNAETATADVAKLTAGSVCISPTSLGLEKIRNDITHYQVPFKELATATTSNTKLRKLIENMIYVGVAAELLGIDFAEVEKVIKEQFKGKANAADLNILAACKGRDYAKTNLKKVDPYFIERLDKTKNMIIIDGNSAAAVGCMFAGVTVLSWYPITPSSSLGESLTAFMHQHRISKESGKPTFAVVQAEDELAALGMALGAGWAGARAMTCTSGPGISLMSELTGLGYFAEIPAVIFDVQRVGPSTGLPTRTSQGDLLSVYQLSHGDTKHIVLLPGSVEELYSMAVSAFDLAERFQTPVFVLSDLDLGMNLWMSEPFKYPDQPMDRGKVLTAEDLTRIGGFARYKDVDGDGIPYRTLPGTNHPKAAYFTRGTGHNQSAGYTENPDEFRMLMDRLLRKYKTASGYVPEPVIDINAEAKVGIIAFGSSDFAVVEARDQLAESCKNGNGKVNSISGDGAIAAAEGTGNSGDSTTIISGLKTSYLRLRAVPCTEAVRQFVESHERVYVVDQNRDAQLRDLLILTMPDLAAKFRSIVHYDGLPLDAHTVTESIKSQEKRV